MAFVVSLFAWGNAIYTFALTTTLAFAFLQVSGALGWLAGADGDDGDSDHDADADHEDAITMQTPTTMPKATTTQATTTTTCRAAFLPRWAAGGCHFPSFGKRLAPASGCRGWP